MFGRVVEKLKDQGILDNCLIIFVSDHGEMLGERYYRFNKYCLFEGSARVPMILGGTAIPDSLKGTIDHRPAELVDLFPTILAVAQTKSTQVRPGADLLSKPTKQAGFCELHERKDTASYMWRTASYKLILTVKNSNNIELKSSDIVMGELYDLKNDEKEWYNLYDNHRFDKIRKELYDQLITFMINKVNDKSN